jgi:peptidoglycan/xylan/chitin deacetylase (PgdA/CDA1 family)
VRAIRGHIGGYLVHWERRSVQLLALVGLALTAALGVVLPFGDAPDGKADPKPGASARGTAKPSLVLPAPSAADREARAVAKVAATGEAIRSGGGRRHLVALTFDDGPGPYTERIVRELERLHVPATFFQVGRELPEFPAAAARTSEAPDVVIGDHTFSHAPMNRLSAAEQKQEILSAATAMLDHGEAQPRLFRPPYGVWDAHTRALTRTRGMAMILWNVDSEDYTRPGVDRIVHNVMSEVKPGSIVLMHDAGGDRTQTLAALPKIVHRLRRRGFGLVTVPKLLLEDPPQADDTARPAQVAGESGAGL